MLVGSGAAAGVDGFSWWRGLLALVVALALQVGVNYANDYSDGVRGTDADRVGPFRLVGAGMASPSAVKRAAVIAFAVAALAGLTLAATSSWWLVAVGAVSIAAAWFYTGGRRPYGYRALGEVAVFVFFGVVAVLGTMYVQALTVSWLAVGGAVAIGALASALLVANNLRDIPTDRRAGKRTLAVVLGDRSARGLYAGLVAVAYAVVVIAALTGAPWAALTVLTLPLGMHAVRRVLSSASGAALVPVLRDTGLLELAFGALLGLGLALSG